MKSVIMTAQEAREFAQLGGLTITKPIKPAPPPYVEGAQIVERSPGRWLLVGPDGDLDAAERVANTYTPPVQPGDAVFIREPWHYLHELNSSGPDGVALASELDPEEAKGRKWASPVSMPETAARRFARVRSVATAYGFSAASVWLVELEALDKAAAVALDAGLPVSTAPDPEGASDYYTYSGDMTAVEYERMVAAIYADRARLAKVQDRLIWIDVRRRELSALLFEERDKVDSNDRDGLEAENTDLDKEQADLAREEAELRAALMDAGAPAPTVGEHAREKLAALEIGEQNAAHSLADLRAADSFGETGEARASLTQELDRIAEEERVLHDYLDTIDGPSEAEDGHEADAEGEEPTTAADAGQGTPEGEEDEETGSFTLGKCKYCGREWGVTLEGSKTGGYPTQRTANAAATRLCDCTEAVENRAPIIGVAMAVTTGACQYCGQMQEVGPHPSQAAADETASEVCNCPRAREERRVRERAEDARERVQRLFGEEAETLGFKPVSDDAVLLCERVVEMIARGPISSASLNIRGQCKAKFNVTSKGKIKVSRSETRSCDLEAGE